MEAAGEAYTVFVNTATILCKELGLTEWQMDYKYEALDSPKESDVKIDFIHRKATLILNTSVTDTDTAKKEATESACLILMASMILKELAYEFNSFRRLPKQG